MDANDVRRIALDLIFQEVLYGLEGKDAERYCAYEAGVHDMMKSVIDAMEEKHDG